jgi:lipoprotein-anchoring transpeptidase ErfK/SrfK
VAGDVGPLVDTVQQRLVWLGYPVKPTHVMDRATLGAVSTFRSKWGLGSTAVVTASVWKKLSSVTRSKGVLPSACTRSSLVLCVDKTARVLRVVRKGKVVLTVDARFGGPGFETRNGTFRVYRKSRDHVSTEYHTPMPFAMFFSGGQAVHYSPFFHRDGYNGHSHGCVNLRDKKTAALLFGQVPVGTRVVVYP